MSLLLLVRHGRTAANATGILAGRTPGVTLDEVGVAAAEALRGRLAHAPLVAAITSPLERCRQTAEIVADGRIPVRTDDGILECDYGEWTGRGLEELRQQSLWETIQQRPSTVTFPGGEAFQDMQNRAVATIREHAAAVDREHGEDAAWLAFSHGDVIKAIITDAMGAPLDRLQRFMVDPCSVTAIRYTGESTLVHVVNAAGPDPIAALLSRQDADTNDTTSDATTAHEGIVGGGA